MNKSEELTLRPATQEDELLLLKWRNLPEVFRFSKNSFPISPAEHKRWFADSLKRDDRFIFIAVLSEQLVGMIRFDRKTSDSYEVSILVDPNQVGRGLGTKLLLRGEQVLSKLGKVRQILAQVRKDNSASLKMFTRCSYEQIGQEGEFLSFSKTLR